MSYVVEVQEDQDGDLFIVLPEDLTEELHWQEGDVLNWDVHGEGIILSKVHGPAGYQVEEE